MASANADLLAALTTYIVHVIYCQREYSLAACTEILCGTIHFHACCDESVTGRAVDTQYL